MGTRFSTFRALASALLACLTALVTPSLSLGGGNCAYLPKTGPAPLRFSEPIIEQPVPEFLKPPKVVPPVFETVSEEDFESLMKAEIAVATNSAFASSTSGTNGISGAKNESPATLMQSQPVYLPADDVTVLTQQTMAELFKPVVGLTNRIPVTVLLPVETGFAPPAPKAAESSRATYTSQ